MVKWIEWRFVYKLWWAFITYWDQGWAGKVPGVQETLIRSRSNFSGTSDFQNKQNSHFLVIWQWNEFSTKVCPKIMYALCVQKHRILNTWSILAQILYINYLRNFSLTQLTMPFLRFFSWKYPLTMENVQKGWEKFLQKCLFLSIASLSETW